MARPEQTVGGNIAKSRPHPHVGGGRARQFADQQTAAGVRDVGRRDFVEAGLSMRSTAMMVPLTLLLAAVSGCVVSVDEVVSDADATFDPRLVGTWEAVSSSDRAVISRAYDNTYAVEYTSSGELSSFSARLGSLGGRLVLDVWPTPRDGDLPEPYEGLMIAGHLLFVVDIGSDEIRTAALDADSLFARLRTEQLRLTHRRTDERLVLHGTTNELRAALGSHLAYPGALSEPSVWRRKQVTEHMEPPTRVVIPCFEASAWREADRLFHLDPQWVGGDGASSADLGSGRILWLFGDSWVDTTGRGTREDARMVSNSVAIQNGTDPATASIRFYWGRAADGGPAAFIPDEGDERHWFGNGVRIGERLLLFLNRVRSTNFGIGFESVGWTAWMVDNPDAEPSTWRMARLATPTNPLGVLVGFAAVLRLGEHLYAFGSQDPVKSHPIFAVRWSLHQAGQGDLSNPEWWAGQRLGWVPDSSTAPRQPLFENGQSELTIHADEATGQLLAVQTQGFGPADVMIRAATALAGPWSEPRTLFRPPEYYRPNVMIYAAKAHPELTGAHLVLTYATNTLRFEEQLSDSMIYYPRFVRLARCQ